MRIWDINPGYLCRQGLLEEHCDLHELVSILSTNRRGYSCHPEIARWSGCGWALRQRHRLLVAEMLLRGISDDSPVLTRARKGKWPKAYVDDPLRQFQILEAEYVDKDHGRIPLPKNAQQLWGQHKYSVLARNAGLYRSLGKSLSSMRSPHDLAELTRELTELLRNPPLMGGIRDSLQHMWGHVSGCCPSGLKDDVESWPSGRLLREIQRRALTCKEPYLIVSTALSELGAWMQET